MRISDWSSDVCSSDLKGHECVVYDSHPEAVAQARGHGAKGCADLAELVSTLSRPRVLWLMVPAAVVDGVLESLLPLLDKDDIVIDGGNRSEEHTSELQSLMRISYAVFCLKKNKKKRRRFANITQTRTNN